MRLVDTSVWIEWLTGSPLGVTLAAELPGRAQWLVPTIVQLDLAKWVTREAGTPSATQARAPSSATQTTRSTHRETRATA